MHAIELLSLGSNGFQVSPPHLPLTTARTMYDVSLRVTLLALASCCLILHTARANPSGGTVTTGNVTIGGSGPGQVTVNQTSQRAIVRWQQFSIENGETTTFVQPGGSSAILNRVTGGSASRLDGRLNANGQVYLVNPSGVVVGKRGVINAGGFTASTLDVADSQFMRGGDLNFSGDSTAAVVNHGRIRAMNGDVTLVSRQVENHGKISARNGRVQLAAGSEVLIKSEGSERVFISPGAQGAKGKTGIDNTGKISAAVVELKAAGGNEYALAINNKGLIRATGSRTEKGRVYLTSSGGSIVNGSGGTIRATSRDGSGGEVRIAGGSITLKRNSRIDASASTRRGGNGGTVLIGGEARGGGTMEIRADAVAFDAPAPRDGGKVVLWSTGTTRFDGSISAQDAGGSGGWVETSGLEHLALGDSASVLTGGGEWLLDPQWIYIIQTGGAATSIAEANARPDAELSVSAVVIMAALLSGNVTLIASQKITLNAGVTITWNNSNKLNFQAPIVELLGTLNNVIPAPNPTPVIVTVTVVDTPAPIPVVIAPVVATPVTEVTPVPTQSTTQLTLQLVYTVQEAISSSSALANPTTNTPALLVLSTARRSILMRMA